jgi:hypothetical protein
VIHNIVLKTNEVVGAWYGAPNCCIFASAVLADVLHARGYTTARPLRIDAAARDRHGAWVVAGARGARASERSNWAGHMGVMVDGALPNPTLAQISGQLPFSGSYDEEWQRAWYAVNSTGEAKQVWTTYSGEGAYNVRYVVIRGRAGCISAPDWRRKRERQSVSRLVLSELARV